VNRPSSIRIAAALAVGLFPLATVTPVGATTVEGTVARVVAAAPAAPAGSEVEVVVAEATGDGLEIRTLTVPSPVDTGALADRLGALPGVVAAEENGSWAPALSPPSNDPYVRSVTHHGGLGHLSLNSPVLGMTPTASGRGYWMAAADGGVFAFGDASFHGSTGHLVLNEAITGMAVSAVGRGYYLVAADGGVFAFGDAAFHGSSAEAVPVSPWWA
jgi:hypothetical protein